MWFVKSFNGIVCLFIPVMPQEMASSAYPVEISFTIEIVRRSIIVHESGNDFDRAVM
jgi:hypothetical protein